MGLASAGGSLKSDLSDFIEGCANKKDGRRANAAAANRRVCGNLEDKGAMLWITPVRACKSKWLF
jgi:hypothetical protein